MTHATAMVVTLALLTVAGPPPVIVQICVGVVGCVPIVTSYEPPLTTGGGNANEPCAVTLTLSVPFSRTRPLPASPVTLPPTVNEFVPQLTTTLFTPPATMVPLLPVTVHVCDGPVGAVATSMS